MDYRFVDSSVLQDCPAAVDMETGLIDVNKDVWDNFDDFQQKFILAHEEGHFVLDTDYEDEADAYALKKLFKTVPRSLKRSLETLYKVGIMDKERLERLYVECLKLDAANGNRRAAKILASNYRNYLVGDSESQPDNDEENNEYDYRYLPPMPKGQPKIRKKDMPYNNVSQRYSKTIKVFGHEIFKADAILYLTFAIFALAFYNTIKSN